jgi:SNF2 family DNA or RNA helicase
MLPIKLYARDNYSYFISFPYDKYLVEKLKSLPGCSWSKPSRAWIGRYIFKDIVIKELFEDPLIKSGAFISKDETLDDYQAYKDFCLELDSLKVQDGSQFDALTIVDKSIKADELGDHQKVGSAFMVVGERVLLADAVGLQKTTTALNACLILEKIRDVHKVIYFTLASLRWQVADEIVKFTGKKVIVVDGSKEERENRYDEWKRSDAMFLVCHYELLVHDSKLLTRLKPSIIIADEVSRVKNFRSKSAKTMARMSSRWFWALGATPLENDFDEIFAIMRVVNPEMLGPFNNFKTYFAKVNFWGAIEKWYPEKIKEFIKRISPFILRRTNEDIGRVLPPAEIIHHWLVMTKEQKALYASLKKDAKDKAEEEENYQALIASLVKIREVCDFPDLVDPSASVSSPKMDRLVKIVKELAGDEKVVVFTQWERAADRIRDRLEKEVIGTVFVSGRIKGPDRQDAVEAFLESKEKRVLVTTDCLAFGMNLQKANNMVIFDLLYNPAKMKQRVGRIKRPGQERSMKIHNLLCKDTVEESMIELLGKKQGMLDLLFDPDSERVKLTTDDLKKVLVGD